MFWLPMLRHSHSPSNSSASTSASTCRETQAQTQPHSLGICHAQDSSPTPSILPPPPSFARNVDRHRHSGRRRSSFTSYPTSHEHCRVVISSRMSSTSGDGNANGSVNGSGSQPPEDTKDGLKLGPPKERRFKLSRYVETCTFFCMSTDGKLLGQPGLATDVGEHFL